MRIKFLFLLSTALACGAQTTPRAAAIPTISGVVAGDDGTAIIGASVALQLMTPYAKPVRKGWSAVSGAGGAFQAVGLLPGQYRICASLAGGAWLDPCE